MRDVDRVMFDNCDTLCQAYLPGQGTLLFSDGPANGRVWHCGDMTASAGGCRSATADMSEGAGTVGRGARESRVAGGRGIAMVGVVRVGGVFVFCGRVVM